MALPREAYELSANSGENVESRPTSTTDPSRLHEGDDANPSTEGDTGESGAQEDAGERTFGGLSPSEAASRRWAKHRERQATEGLHDADDALTVVVPIRRAAILRQLEEQAAKGDTHSARELRAWMKEYPPETLDLDLSSLDREKRKLLQAWLRGDAPATAGIR